MYSSMRYCRWWYIWNACKSALQWNIELAVIEAELYQVFDHAGCVAPLLWPYLGPAAPQLPEERPLLTMLHTRLTGVLAAMLTRYYISSCQFLNYHFQTPGMSADKGTGLFTSHHVLLGWIPMPYIKKMLHLPLVCLFVCLIPSMLYSFSQSEHLYQNIFSTSSGFSERTLRSYSRSKVHLQSCWSEILWR